MKRILSEETKTKMSIARKGRKFTEEHKRKLSESNKLARILNPAPKGESHPLFGKRKSPEERKAISERSRLAWNEFSFEKREEIKKKISISLKGRTFSEESRQKLSQALKGRKFTEEHKQNISAMGKGRLAWNKGLKGIYKASEETKKKMSVSQKGRVLTKEHRVKIGNSRIGAKNPMYGKPPSPKSSRGVKIQHISFIGDAYCLRSRPEKAFAIWLDQRCWRWKYEMKAFPLSSGRTYTPDFFVYNSLGRLTRLYEICGYVSEEKKTKMNQFRKDYPDISIVLLDQKTLNQYYHLSPKFITSLGQGGSYGIRP